MSRRPRKPRESDQRSRIEQTRDQFRANRESLLAMLADLDASRRTVEAARRAWMVTFDAIPDPIFLHDAEYRIVRANRAYAERAGLPFEDLLGRRYWEIFPRGQGPLPGCRSTLAAEEGHEEEVSLPGGEVYRSRAFLLPGETGESRLAVHVMEDITGARRAAAERRLLGEALRQAGGPTIVVDPHGRITHANSAALRLLGYAAVDLIGHSIDCLSVPGAPRELGPAAVVARCRADGIWRGDVLRRHRDGTALPLQLAAAPIHGAGGELLGIVGSYTDLRPFHESQARIEALRAAVEDLSTETDLDRLGVKALNAAMALSGADMGAVALRDADTGRLRYRWRAGIPRDLDESALAQPFDPGQGVGGTAYTTGKPVFIHDYQHFQAALPAFVALGVKQAVSVPLWLHGEPVGALSIGGITHDLRPEHSVMVEAVGRQLSAALERDALLAEVRESERRFRTVVEHVPDILFALSLPDLTPTFVSPAVTGLLGYTPQELTGAPGLWQHAVHEDDRERVGAALAASARSGEPLRLEARLVHKDGAAVRWFRGSAVFESDGGAEPRTAFGVLTDITERRCAEQQLRESEERLKILFEHAPDGIYLIDREGRLVDGNAAAERMVGRPRGELIGRSLADSGIVAPAQLARVQQALAQQLAGASIGPMETELQRADGQRLPVEVHAYPVRIAGSDLLLGIARDISERRASERRYQQLFESMLDAFAVNEIVTDAAGKPVDYRFLAVNSAFERACGLSREAIVGRTFRELFPRGDSKWLDIYAPVALEGRQQRFERYSAELGRHCDIAAFSAGPGQFVTVFRDITPRIEAENGLKRLNRALRTISAGNEALVHATDEQSLLERVCAVLTGIGGYALAWIGYARDDAARSVKVVARSGEAVGYLDGLHVSWGEDARGRGPTGSAIRSGETQVENDLEISSRYAPWRAAALAAGFRASIALPLRVDGEVIGAVNIYARERAAFSEEELELLQELAADVSFGIEAQRVKASREAAERRLRESEHQFRALFDNASDGILVADVDTMRLTAANGRACELLGYDKEELLGLRVTDIHPEQDVERVREVFEQQHRGALRVAQDVLVLRRDGSVFFADVSASPVKFGGKSHMVGLFRDVSDRRRAEAERMVAAERLQNALVQAITAVARTIEKRDPYTSGHQQRVAELAAAIAREMGVDEDRIQGLSLGSLIHDIGKIYIPAEILNRPGRLSSAEFEMIKSHPQVGYDIIRDVEFPWPVAQMVRQHHERLDGSGYPDGLRGDEICLEARILAVADVVEAMSSHRPYRPGRGLDEALAEVRAGRGSRYDAAAVDACLRLLEEKEFRFEAPPRP